ncbi:MAG: GTP 3',8-cyclase MoaA [Thermodesulfovibrionaceae bacterium]
MIDRYNRQINYLRVSVTDRCNLRCIYCMPKSTKKFLPQKEILSYEEILRIISLATKIGINKIRITGGEPLIRKDVVGFIEKASKIREIKDIGLTTNGVLLRKYAKDLKSAGLKRLNISLDSLNRDKYETITGVDALKEVLEGIKEAERLGFDPIKINIVVMKGINDDEIVDFVKWSKKVPYQIRFIEFMPIGENSKWSRDLFMSREEIKKKIERISKLTSVKVDKSGPAEYFTVENSKGLIGFISPLTTHICQRCNRLRLTADGKLRPCLFSDREIDLKSLIRAGANDSLIREMLVNAVYLKPSGISQNAHPLKAMSMIGG